MVLDLNSEDTLNVDEIAPGGKYGYGIGHSDGRHKTPDRVLNTVKERRVRSLPWAPASAVSRWHTSFNLTVRTWTTVISEKN